MSGIFKTGGSILMLEHGKEVSIHRNDLTLHYKTSHPRCCLMWMDAEGLVTSYQSNLISVSKVETSRFTNLFQFHK